MDLPTDQGIGLGGAMIIGQPSNRTQKENFDQLIRVVTTLSEGTTRITTKISTMITKQDHHTSHTKTNPRTGEVKITIHDCHLRHDKTHA